MTGHLRPLFVAGVALGALSLGACSDRQLRGAGLGALGGAAVGAIVPGVGVAEGAAIGAAGGAAVGTIKDRDDRRYYRDADGRRYYINDRGERVYPR